MELINVLVTDFWVAAKVLVLLFLGIYVVFSAVVVKQARLMAETLDVELDGFIVTVSYIHMVLAIGVFVSSAVFL